MIIARIFNRLLIFCRSSLANYDREKKCYGFLFVTPWPIKLRIKIYFKIYLTDL
jgi:hypothetical protein